MENQTWTDLAQSLTLKGVSITGSALGRFGVYTVRQNYENKSGKTLEVFYTFPLSRTASVYDFVARIGDKEIRGLVKEKAQAKKEYQRAIARGDSAYLLEREDANVFKVTLGRIEKGEKVEISLSYIDAHDITDNTVEVRIPTVVAPRYHDPITANQTYREELDYTADIFIHIDDALNIADVKSPSHSIKVENNTVITQKTKLDRDYILYVQLKDEMLSSGYVYKTDNASYAFLQFMPEFPQLKQRDPQKFIFLIDCSGSMSGLKMEKTKTALKKCLSQLLPGDEFVVIRFGSDFDHVESFAQVSEQDLKNAMGLIDTFSANYGGTEIWSPIEYTLKKFEGENTLVLLTDGQVWRADSISEKIRRTVEKNRLFIFGIDSAVNDAGLVSFARAGRGKAEFFTPDEHLDSKIVRQFSRINGTSCAETALDCGKNQTDDVLASEDTVFNREYWCAVVKVSALTDGFALLCKTEDKTFRFAIDPSRLQTTEIALDKIYAKEKIDRLEEYINRNRYHDDVTGYTEEIVKSAILYNIDSKRTSFLAVNERENKLFDVPEQEQVVLENPQGWEMRSAGISYNTSICCCEELRFDFLEEDESMLKRTSHRNFSAVRKRRLSKIVREGSKVTLRFNNGTEKVVIIGEDVKTDSPLALSILGKHEGEEADYTENGVDYHVKILKVEVHK